MSKTTYIEFTFSPLTEESDREILSSQLLDAGFDSFAEDDDTLTAYLPANLLRDDILDGCDFLDRHPQVMVGRKPLEDINWNEEWEKNYQPVVIAGRCMVRAPFHEPLPGMDYDIIIMPRMSFGTAHHETTQLMASWLMELDAEGKDLLDMGCGTGVLAVLANKMGAKSVIGIDNDEWAYRNAMDNYEVNGVLAGEVWLGDAGLLKTGSYDIILANINRNILTADMASYAAALRPGGLILFSGFYREDEPAIHSAARGCGLSYAGTREKNRWAAMLFTK